MDDILKGLQQEKILSNTAGENVVRFLPAYIFEKEHADAVVARLGPVLAAAAAIGS
jgi:acetylornithine/succinyldiaminopimelate/putrescine aminotransferase